jgi:hypothetical protein
MGKGRPKGPTRVHQPTALTPFKPSDCVAHGSLYTVIKTNKGSGLPVSANKTQIKHKPPHCDCKPLSGLNNGYG